MTPSFQYVPAMQLELSSRGHDTASSARPNVEGIIFEGAAPPAANLQLPSSEPTKTAPATAPAAIADAAMRVKLNARAPPMPTIPAPRKGAVAQRLHPHHPIHTEQAVEAPRESGHLASPEPARSSHDGRDGPASKQGMHGSVEMTNAHDNVLQSASPHKVEDVTGIPHQVGVMSRKRTKKPVTSLVARADVKRQLAPKPAWSSRATRSGLFDSALSPRALREVEPQVTQPRALNRLR